MATPQTFQFKKGKVMTENGTIQLPKKEDTFFKVEDENGKFLSEIDIVEGQLKIDELSVGKTTQEWIVEFQKWVEEILETEISIATAWTFALEVQKRFEDYKKKLSPGVISLIGMVSTPSKKPLAPVKQ